MKLTHAGPKDIAREAELRRPSGVVCSDLAMPHHTSFALKSFNISAAFCSPNSITIISHGGEFRIDRRRRRPLERSKW